MPLSRLLKKLPIFRSERENRIENASNPFTGLVYRSDLPRHLRRADQHTALTGSLTYPSRLEPGNIRLLVLYPSSEAQSIRMSTWVRSIDDASDDYCALSYVWGNPDETVPISVDRHEFRATANLATALRHISSMLQDNEVMLLWIDAISINQQDIQERNEQVAVMTHTYENAAFVACWLGEEHVRGVEYLDELGRFATARDEDPASLTMKRSNVDFSTHVKGRYQDIRAVVQLMSCPYWDRVWTVQEYSSPKPGVFFSCTSWMDKGVFTPALRLFTQSLKILARSYERQGNNAFFVDLTLQQTQRLIHSHSLSYVRANPSAFSAEHLDSFRLLLRFWKMKSSDPRDKVYAPLAMTKSSQGLLEAIKVDYGISVAELYIRVAVLWTASGKWPLAILELCRFNANRHLPSWVPDWTQIPRNVLSQDGNTGEQVVCASKGAFATASSPPAHHISENGENLLSIDAIRVDSVVHVWPAMSSQEILKGQEFSIEVTDVQDTYIATGETLGSAYRNAMYPGLSDGEPEVAANGTLVLATRKEWRLNPKMIPRIDRRRLARTSTGFVGLIPAEAEPDDELWLVRGANMFYILRPDDGRTHLLIGEAYIHGLMQGELASRKDFYPPGLPEAETVMLR